MNLIRCKILTGIFLITCSMNFSTKAIAQGEGFVRQVDVDRMGSNSIDFAMYASVRVLHEFCLPSVRVDMTQVLYGRTLILEPVFRYDGDGDVRCTERGAILMIDVPLTLYNISKVELRHYKRVGNAEDITYLFQ